MPPIPRSARPSPLVGLTGTAIVAASLAVVITGGSLALGIDLPFGLGARGEVAGRTSEPGQGPPTPRPSPTDPAAIAVPSPSAPASAPPSAPPDAGPTATPAPTAEPVAQGPFEMNLYGSRDFVSQATLKQCVAGAMQTMLNVMDVSNDRTKRFQTEIAKVAKRLSDHPDDGTEPEGWAAGLERLGGGSYEVATAKTRSAAIKLAARAIRETGRPVGLLVWRGAHSWVMHGFRATADPAAGSSFRVTHVWLSDPWYPRVSSIWGPSRKPNTRVAVSRVGEDYLPWRRPTGRYPGKDGRFVLVVPVSD